MPSQCIKLETPEGIVFDVDVDFEVTREQRDCGHRGGVEVHKIHIPKDATDVKSLKYLTSDEAIAHAETIIDVEWT